ncbi:MAG: helix-turn-helix domain-containing protein, partial [Verrucomicrobiota bacterium]
KRLGLLTVAEAADYLNMPRPTLYQHLREGQIPGIQIGGRWRIEVDKLNEFIVNARGGGGNVATVEGEDRSAPMAAPGMGSSDEITRLRKENERLRAIVAEQLLQIHSLSRD